MARKHIVLGKNDGDIAEFVEGKVFSSYVKSLIRSDMKRIREGGQATSDIAECKEMFSVIMEKLNSGELLIANNGKKSEEVVITEKKKNSVKKIMKGLGNKKAIEKESPVEDEKGVIT